MVLKKVSRGFSTEKGANCKIIGREIINFIGVNTVYLRNKVYDLFKDIKNDFHELQLLAGGNNTQFQITFKNNATLVVGEAISQNFMIFQNHPIDNSTIDNPLLMDLEICDLYHVAGKLISVKKD